MELSCSYGKLEGWVNGELQLELLSIIDRETLYQQGGEPGTSYPTKAVRNQDAPKACALVSQFPHLVQIEVNVLLALV